MKFSILLISVADFVLSEYELLFGAGYREAVFYFEVYDDEISEKEETLILYTNYTESPHDRCAVAVQILDNDREYYIIIID